MSDSESPKESTSGAFFAAAVDVGFEQDATFDNIEGDLTEEDRDDGSHLDKGQLDQAPDRAQDQSHHTDCRRSPCRRDTATISGAFFPGAKGILFRGKASFQNVEGNMKKTIIRSHTDPATRSPRYHGYTTQSEDGYSDETLDDSKDPATSGHNLVACTSMTTAPESYHRHNNPRPPRDRPLRLTNTHTRPHSGFMVSSVSYAQHGQSTS